MNYHMKKTAFAFVVLISAVSSASAQNGLPKFMGGGYGKYGIGTNQSGTLVNPYATQRKKVQPQPNDANSTQKRK